MRGRLALLYQRNVSVRARGDAAGGGGLIDNLLRNGKVDGYAEGWAAALDLLLLGESAALVGKFTSNLDRIAYALMSARGALPAAVRLARRRLVLRLRRPRLRRRAERDAVSVLRAL